MEYKVEVNFLTSNQNGNSKWNEVQFEFKNDNLIDSRNIAILTTKCLLNYFNNIPMDEKLNSHIESTLNGYKDFMAYSIDIYFIPEEGYDYQIYGEDELTIDALEEEAIYFDDLQPKCWINNLYGEKAKVLQYDLEFLIKDESVIGYY